PYTRTLLSALPVPDPRRRKQRMTLGGDVPSPVSPAPGCAFHPRCGHALEVCRRETPPLDTGRGGHAVACHVFPAAGVSTGDVETRCLVVQEGATFDGNSRMGGQRPDAPEAAK